MGTKQLIREITRLPFDRRVLVVEQLLKSIREKEKKEFPVVKQDKIEKAVKQLLKEYSDNKELTVFTNIDFEEFYEAR